MYDQFIYIFVIQSVSFFITWLINFAYEDNWSAIENQLQFR